LNEFQLRLSWISFFGIGRHFNKGDALRQWEKHPDLVKVRQVSPAPFPSALSGRDVFYPIPRAALRFALGWFALPFQGVSIITDITGSTQNHH